MNMLPYANFSQLAAAAARPAAQIDAARPIWIFGAGNFGRSLCRAMQGNGIQVAGFVETAPKIGSVSDLPVVDWPTLAHKDKAAQLALGILNRATPFDELVSIAAKGGFSQMLMPWDTYDAYSQELGWRFWLSKRDFLISGLERMARVAERLADQESRDILLRMAAFRLGLDLPFASFCSEEKQYFNEITLHSLSKKPITYVDCGAYTGDTFSDLVSQPDIHCTQAFLLEPDPGNFDTLTGNIRVRHPQAICLPLAAADKYSILTFSSGQGEGGQIGVHGDIHIAAVALDQMLPQIQVDLIKLDVEGAEAQVLDGARRTIERCRPVLTMSLYHNPQDPWALPELLFELCPDYAFYIRQHYFNSFESVLYAVPRSR